MKNNKSLNYLILNSPINGNLSELGGMQSATTSKNTVILSKVVTPIVTFCRN